MAVGRSGCLCASAKCQVPSAPRSRGPPRAPGPRPRARPPPTRNSKSATVSSRPLCRPHSPASGGLFAARSAISTTASSRASRLLGCFGWLRSRPSPPIDSDRVLRCWLNRDTQVAQSLNRLFQGIAGLGCFAGRPRGAVQKALQGGRFAATGGSSDSPEARGVFDAAARKGGGGGGCKPPSSRRALDDRLFQGRRCSVSKDDNFSASSHTNLNTKF